MNEKSIQFAAVAALLSGAVGLMIGPPTTAPEWPELVVEAVDYDRGVLETRPHRRDAGATHTPGARLVLADGLEPLGWCEGLAGGATRCWRLAGERLPPVPVDRLRAWVIDPTTVSRTMAAWPVEADVSATVDSIGPGARMVWVAAGERQEVSVGDVWLRRGGGQPLARLEAFFVTPSLTACRVVPLVSDLRLAAGDGVSRWPTPAARRAGLVRSAVAFVEEAGDAQMLWIAAPPGTDPQAAASVDVFRDGRYVAFAPIERRDDRFWFARTLPAAAAGPARVGDDVRVRSGASVAASLTARVFRMTPEPLITAGEQDGLAAGVAGEVYRDNRRIGSVRVVSVQPTYAVVRAEPAEAVLERLDEVRFGPPPPDETLVGRVSAVVDRTLLQVELDGARRANTEPLAVRSPAGRLLGVGLVIAQEGDVALAIVPEASLTAPIAPASLLLRRGAASGTEQASQHRPR